VSGLATHLLPIIFSDLYFFFYHMPTAFQIHKQDSTYFLTLQIVYWIDIFSRKRYRDIICDSLNFCVEEKGLEIFAYVIMSNHVHIMPPRWS